MKKFIVNTDGASRSNPGQAAASFIITDQEGNFVDSGGAYLGIATNNEAEYLGVRMALERVRELSKKGFPNEVLVRADSMLIVNQLNGSFKIKNLNLKTLYESVKKLESEIGFVSYTYIPREQNSKADNLANNILDNLTY